MADLEVILTRRETGYFNTFGTLNVVIRNSRIAADFELSIIEWKVLELPWGNFALRIEDATRGHAPRPFRSAGPFRNAGLREAKMTSPRALAPALGGKLPPRPRGVSVAEYEEAIVKSFNIGQGTINIHAGHGSWHSFFCPIIGHEEVAMKVPPALVRHSYPHVPAEPPGKYYTTYGFSTEDSLLAQVEFNLIFARAASILGKRPRVSFALASAKAPPFRGELRHPR